MKESHLFDPKNTDFLEMEERKIWQNTEEILRMIEIKSEFAVAYICIDAHASTTKL